MGSLGNRQTVTGKQNSLRKSWMDLRKLNGDDDALKELLKELSVQSRYLMMRHAVHFEIERRVPKWPTSVYVATSSSTAEGEPKCYFAFQHNFIPNGVGPSLVALTNGDAAQCKDLFAAALGSLLDVEETAAELDLLIVELPLAQVAEEVLRSKFHVRRFGHDACKLFYIRKEHFDKVLESESRPLPENFLLDSADRESDATAINQLWKYGIRDDDRKQRETLIRHPSSCIRLAATGEPVSFEFAGLHGHLSAQFTLAEYRNRGFATIVEEDLCRKCIRRGIVPYKAVELTNDAVIRRCERNSSWTAVGTDSGDALCFDYIGIKQEKRH